MPNNWPIVFVHGYSDSGKSWLPWVNILAQRLERPASDLRTVTYVSLNNEITIKDIAEGFDRALTTQGVLQEFDAIVHSTGMQVVRSWLRTDPRRIARLKRLIAFAPATFGSPIATQGRSWLGALFKGNKSLGPDFLNAGDIVLQNLEPASVFGWELAECDIVAGTRRYDAGPDTPYVFVFCGTGKYTGIRELADKPGTDGTVRRAGCGMRVRKIELDLTDQALVARRRSPALAAKEQITEADRILVSDWLQGNIPVHLIGAPDDDHETPNHATILSDPPQDLQDLVVSALQRTADPATAEAGYAAWLGEARADARIAQMQKKYQQFIVHAVDERGDPVNDYNFQLFRVDGSPNGQRLSQFTAEVDVYDADRSFRCFHVDVTDLLPQDGQPAAGLSFRIIADAGTPYIGYIGYGAEQQIDAQDKTDSTAWDATVTFTGETLRQFAFFQPYTTTLIRLYIERQVLPPDRSLPCDLVKWDPPLVTDLPTDARPQSPGAAVV
jgi:pimeloyl-ACP methyl ester carboxylesterase